MAGITGTFKTESSRVRESNDWYLKFQSRARGVRASATPIANLRVQAERVIYRRRLRGNGAPRFLCCETPHHDANYCGRSSWPAAESAARVAHADDFGARARIDFLAPRSADGSRRGARARYFRRQRLARYRVAFARRVICKLY